MGTATAAHGGSETYVDVYLDSWVMLVVAGRLALEKAASGEAKRPHHDMHRERAVCA